LADSAYSGGKYDEAYGYYMAAYQKRRDWPGVLVKAACCLLNEAKREFDAHLFDDPQAKFARAIGLFKEAIAAGCRTAPAYRGLAECLSMYN
jgi:tetratricopeptide (TPR) repeat protein